MTAEDTRRRISAASATTHIDKTSMGRNAGADRAGIIGWLSHLAGEWRGAAEDHRKWIDSERARTLGTAFALSGRLLDYAAYAALAYLAYSSFVDIRDGLATGVYDISVQIDSPRAALFNILAAGLAGPLAIIAIGFLVGWMYNLTTAMGNWALPRFARPWIHPSILLAVVAALAVFQSVVTETVAKGYLLAQANTEAARPRENAFVKVIEIPTPDFEGAAEAAVHEPSGERELVRLRSIFEAGRPCTNEGQGTEPNPESDPDAVVARPEPGLAPRQDCRAEKSAAQK